ncbi:MAG: amidohydrolase family protein [Candidatus Omnitrophica bacterium]|nr:amidohydrolase family protein [Candidatus Omnitrophota bacterium]
MTRRVERLERSFATDLERAVFKTPLCDTHEHLQYENAWIEEKADVLSDLLNNYVPADLLTAGASQKAVERALDPKDPDIAGRLAGVLPALERSRYTGYGETVYLCARHVYGIEELTAAALAEAQPILEGLKQPGERLRLLRDVAGLEHVQTDDFVWTALPDPSGKDFFFYDLSWRNFCNGEIPVEEIHKETGIEVKDLEDLDEAMEKLFEKFATCAIAVKSQHAYNRTLSWRERERADAAIALNKLLSHPDTELAEEDRLCLGDYCWAKGVEHSIRHELPFKLHTGYYVGNQHMRTERIPAGNLCPLLIKYPEARFVLMHIAYPYQEELVAIIKHFHNTVVDLCWAWSIDPYSTKDFLRRALRAAPLNQVLGFGGDTGKPTSAYAYSIQARTWLARTLAEEVKEGALSESEAVRVAKVWMCENQREYFELEKKRRLVAAWSGPMLEK